MVAGKFFASNLGRTMDAYVQQKTPAVTYTGTMSGGIGAQALRRFYQHYFIGKLPPSMHLRLVSRTAGADRIVDELYVSFEHTQEVPWMLPGVPPTKKQVEIILVSIVSMRGGKLYSEHVYWDQASVLVQIGLLDPKLVPGGVQGVERLPVVGREAARRILHEDTELEQEDYHNRLVRRAHARARREKSERASVAGDSVAGDSVADTKSEADQSVNGEDKKGKSVLRERPAKLEGNGTEKTEDDGAETETESSVKDKGKENGKEDGAKSATVEDAGDE